MTQKNKVFKRTWRKEHPEEHRKQQREYYERNKEKKISSVKEWKKQHPVKKKEIADRSRLKKQGWTLEGVKEAKIRQHNRCAICRDKFIQTPCADHEHTNPPKPRGLLCHLCNVALGALKDSSKLCEQAANYLRRYGK